jgi:hypothetical protein
LGGLGEGWRVWSNVFSFIKFSQSGDPKKKKNKKKKTASANCTNSFLILKNEKKNRHLLRKIIHISPYLDNEFLEVARIILIYIKLKSDV